MNKKNEHVLIKWLDAAGMDAGWHVPDDVMLHTVVPCETAGVILNTNELCVVIAGTQSLNGDCSDVCAIPRGAITEVRSMKSGKKLSLWKK